MKIAQQMAVCVFVLFEDEKAKEERNANVTCLFV